MDSSNDRALPEPTSYTVEHAPSAEVDSAIAEYFTTMAFDERLHFLLDNEVPEVEVSASTAVSALTSEPGKRYFRPNQTTTEDFIIDDDLIEQIEVPSFAYSAHGRLNLHPKELVADITVTPDGEYGDPVRIESVPGHPNAYLISQPTGELSFDNVDVIDSTQLFSLLCQLGGAGQASIDATLRALDSDHPSTNKTLRKYAFDLWGSLGETYGIKETTRTISHSTERPTETFDTTRITLTHKEIEEPDKTVIELYLNHITHSASLNLSDIYSLRVAFTQQNGRAQRDAKHVIQSGDLPELTAISLHRQNNGTSRQLDVDAMTIKELFVDWFDQLLSA